MGYVSHFTNSVGYGTPSVSPSEIQEIQGTKLKALAHGAVLPGGNRFPRFPHILGIWGPEMEIPKWSKMNGLLNDFGGTKRITGWKPPVIHLEYISGEYIEDP